MMEKKALFVVGTGTDVGKTYITALLVKKCREQKYDCGYYKAAMSGANDIAHSDAGYVNKVASIGQEEQTLVSYFYHTAVSPHLAARLEGHPLEMAQVKRDFANVQERYPYVIMEGSGGILCPLRYDTEAKIFLTDVIQELKLPVVVVGKAGLGSINAVGLTIHYLHAQNIPVRGIILNDYMPSVLDDDNVQMIEQLTGEKVLALVAKGANDIEIDLKKLWPDARKSDGNGAR